MSSNWRERHNERVQSEKKQPESQPANDSHAGGRPRGFLRSADTYKARNHKWLWLNRIAQGVLHLLAGAPGTGKSTISLQFAAAISCGGKFPNGADAPLGTAVIWSGEDLIEQTIVPRLLAAGADMSRIKIIDGHDEGGKPVTFKPSEHMPMLLEELKEIDDLKLVVIDPVVSTIKGDSNNNGDVRNGLQPLVDLLKQAGAAGIGITHFSKNSSGRRPGERVIGSIAFEALGRGLFTTAQVKGKDNEYVFVIAKTSHGKPGDGYQYGFEECVVDGVDDDGNPVDVGTSRIAWGESLMGSAGDLLDDAEGVHEGRGRPSKQAPAAALLMALLANGPMPKSKVEKAAEEARISIDTLRRAGKPFGLVSKRVNPKDPSSEYVWSLAKGAGGAGASDGAQELPDEARGAGLQK
jgi:putative DNA primase/helicase